MASSGTPNVASFLDQFTKGSTEYVALLISLTTDDEHNTRLQILIDMFLVKKEAVIKSNFPGRPGIYLPTKKNFDNFLELYKCEKNGKVGYHPIEAYKKFMQEVLALDVVQMKNNNTEVPVTLREVFKNAFIVFSYLLMEQYPRASGKSLNQIFQ
jgi:hypothetical protein